VERLVNSLMMHGRNNGKKLKAIRIVRTTFEIIHLITGNNPVQVFCEVNHLYHSHHLHHLTHYSNVWKRGKRGWMNWCQKWNMRMKGAKLVRGITEKGQVDSVVAVCIRAL
jgi:hypothetical protein